MQKHQLVPMGEYEATLYSIDDGEPTQHGDIWIWTFVVSGGDLAGTEITGVSSQTYSDYPSKSYRWAAALGHPPDQDFNSDLVLNKPCRIGVQVVEKDDGVRRNKITDVMSPSKQQVAEAQELAL